MVKNIGMNHIGRCAELDYLSVHSSIMFIIAIIASKGSVAAGLKVFYRVILLKLSCITININAIKDSFITLKMI